MTQLWRATLYFGTKNSSFENQHTIQFSSSTDIAGTKASVYRWWNNRHEAIPEIFDRLYCIKLFPVTPQEIDEKGYLPSDSGLFSSEWKCDHGPIKFWLESGR